MGFLPCFLRGSSSGLKAEGSSRLARRAKVNGLERPDFQTKGTSTMRYRTSRVSQFRSPPAHLCENSSVSSFRQTQTCTQKNSTAKVPREPGVPLFYTSQLFAPLLSPGLGEVNLTPPRRLDDEAFVRTRLAFSVGPPS